VWGVACQQISQQFDFIIDILLTVVHICELLLCIILPVWNCLIDWFHHQQAGGF
jgi:hypothetical protein